MSVNRESWVSCVIILNHAPHPGKSCALGYCYSSLLHIESTNIIISHVNKIKVQRDNRIFLRPTKARGISASQKPTARDDCFSPDSDRRSQRRVRGSRSTIIIIIVKSDRNAIESLKWATEVMRSDPVWAFATPLNRLPSITFLTDAFTIGTGGHQAGMRLKAGYGISIHRTVNAPDSATWNLRLRIREGLDRVAASAAKPVDGLAASIVWPAKSSGPRVEEYSWRCIRRAFNGFRFADVSVRYANICIYMHITAVFANAKGARIVSSLRFSSIARCTRIFTLYFMLRIFEIVERIICLCQ